MTTKELRYALAKQVDSMYAIETDYGPIHMTDLDHGAWDRIKDAVRKELERELERRVRDMRASV